MEFNMQIIILAAGIGSRLGNPFPKPLTPLSNNKSIMQMQMENLTKYFDINSINTIVGFKKELIMESFPDVKYIYNNFFDTTNTSKSLLKGLSKLEYDDVLWLNGDVVFEADILKELLANIHKQESFMAVNTSRVAEEEVKYITKDGYITDVSKEVQNGEGEAVGINFISKKDVPFLIKGLQKCDDSDYFEKGIEYCIKDYGINFKAIDISKFECIEIDFKEDLENANSIVTNENFNK
jgi:choline kinase